MARAAKFEWDGANIGHIARHGVTPEEVEEAFANDPLVVLTVHRRSGEERIPCAGLTDIERARKLAVKRGVGYQTVIKTLLHEALRKESRVA